jgi:RNA polymerase sigma factor (sigma-70 family)
MGEKRLSSRAAAGDTAAFAEIYRRHHQALFRYCLALLRDPDDAADSLQTTMAKALSALEEGGPVKGVRPWLFRIAHNTAVDHLRRRRPQAALDELSEVESSTLTAPSAASEAESRAALAEAVADIRELPERQGSALIMRELSALSYADIALALSTSEAAVRQLVHQARTVLHARRTGRSVECEAVRQALSDRDGETPRDQRMRAHLAACSDCREFQSSIVRRRAALAALVPPLAPGTSDYLLRRLVGHAPHSGGGIGGGLTGGVAKLAGTSTASQLAAGALVGAVAVVSAGGILAAAGGLSGRDVGPSGPQAGVPSFLDPGTPALHPFGPSGGAGEGAGRGADEGAGGDAAGRAPSGGPGSSAGAANGPADGLGPLAATPVQGRGPVEGVNGVDDLTDRGPVEVALSDPTASLGSGPDAVVPGGRVPDVEAPSANLPNSGGPNLPDTGLPQVPGQSPQVPGGVTVPEVPTPNIPSVDVPTVPSPSVGNVGAPEVTAPRVNVPTPQVNVPAPQVSAPPGGGAGAPVP